MLLPQTAEYALRAMSCIALKEGKQPVSSKVLARSTGIPSHYLSKIMRKLVEADLVTSRKGHGGGFRLALEPQEITFNKVLEAIGYKTDPNVCVFGWNQCNSERPCPLHFAWSQIKDEFHYWADNMTLQEVVDNPGFIHSNASKFQNE